MTAVRYDFSEAEKELQTEYTPRELSAMLKDAVLEAVAYGGDEDIAPIKFRALTQSAIQVCSFLDKVREKP